MSKQTIRTYKSKEYNGWSNWYTWNVAMWLQNTLDDLEAIEYYREDQQLRGKSLNYDRFLEHAGIDPKEKTPDGVMYGSSSINRKEMREMLALA